MPWLNKQGNVVFPLYHIFAEPSSSYHTHVSQDPERWFPPYVWEAPTPLIHHQPSFVYSISSRGRGVARPIEASVSTETSPKAKLYATVMRECNAPLHQHLTTIHGLRDLHMAKNRDTHVLALRKLIANEELSAELFPQVCLLYTSPSPRDLSTSRMPSSA